MGQQESRGAKGNFHSLSVDEDGATAAGKKTPETGPTPKTSRGGKYFKRAQSLDPRGHKDRPHSASSLKGLPKGRAKAADFLRTGKGSPTPSHSSQRSDVSVNSEPVGPASVQSQVTAQPAQPYVKPGGDVRPRSAPFVAEQGVKIGLNLGEKVSAKRSRQELEESSEVQCVVQTENEASNGAFISSESAEKPSEKALAPRASIDECELMESLREESIFFNPNYESEQSPESETKSRGSSAERSKIEAAAAANVFSNSQKRLTSSTAESKADKKFTSPFQFRATAISKTASGQNSVISPAATANKTVFSQMSTSSLITVARREPISPLYQSRTRNSRTVESDKSPGSGNEGLIYVKNSTESPRITNQENIDIHLTSSRVLDSNESSTDPVIGAVPETSYDQGRCDLVQEDNTVSTDSVHILLNNQSQSDHQHDYTNSQQINAQNRVSDTISASIHSTEPTDNMGNDNSTSVPASALQCTVAPAEWDTPFVSPPSGGDQLTTGANLEVRQSSSTANSLSSEDVFVDARESTHAVNSDAGLVISGNSDINVVDTAGQGDVRLSSPASSELKVSPEGTFNSELTRMKEDPTKQNNSTLNTTSTPMKCRSEDLNYTSSPLSDFDLSQRDNTLDTLESVKQLIDSNLSHIFQGSSSYHEDEDDKMFPSGEQALSRSWCQEETEKPLYPKGKSISMDNLDSAPPRSHKPVVPNYTVATSRVLSQPSLKGRTRHMSASSTLDSSMKSEGKDSYHSPYTKKKKIVSAGVTPETEGLPFSFGQNDAHHQETATNKVSHKLSMSVDSGLESQPIKRCFVTNINDVKFNFGKQNNQHIDHDRNETSPENGTGAVFNGNHSQTVDVKIRNLSRMFSDSLLDEHVTLRNDNKKRIRGKSQDSFFPDSDDDSFLCDDREPSGKSRMDKPVMRRLPPKNNSIDETITCPKTVPEKLDFKRLEKFEGHSLISWLSLSFGEEHYLYYYLSRQDIKVLVVQICTNLLAAGVIRALEDDQSPSPIFKADSMYYWTHTEQTPLMTEILPNKISPIWPPPKGDSAEIHPSQKYSEADVQQMMVMLQKEHKAELEKLKKDHDNELIDALDHQEVKIADYESKILELEREVEKYKIFAGIESLRMEALWDGESSPETDYPTHGKFDVTKDSGKKVTQRKVATVTPTLSGRDDDGSSRPPPSMTVPPPPPPPMVPTSTIPPPPPPPPAMGGIPPPPPPPPPPLMGGIPPPPPPPPPPVFGSIPPPPPPPPLGAGIPPPPPPPPGMGGPPPPPPPPPGMGGPPPPPPPPPGMGGPPPPPPPPPGMGGPPPPPPPLGAPTSLAFKPRVVLGPRKSAVTTKSQMKPLFWKRILVPAPKPDVSVGSSESDDEDKLEVKPVWENLKEPDVDMDEFDCLFSRVVVQKKKPADEQKAKPKAKKQVAKLLDAKRSQALAIFQTGLHLTMCDIENAILLFDASVLPLDVLQALYENRPEPEELTSIRAHVENSPDIPLDKPEQFLYDISTIPSFTERTFCLIFQSTYYEVIDGMERKLNNIKMTSQMLMHGKEVKTVLGLILVLGNYMNGGTARGQADGFGLEILSKLKDVRSKDNSMNLLNFVVSQYVKAHDPDSGTDKAKLPIPEPSDINKAGLINFEEIENDLKKAKLDLDGCERKSKKVIESSSEETLQPFKDNVTTFIEKGRRDFQEQKENLEEAIKKFEQILVFFSLNNMAPKDFFALWSSFCADFKDQWQKEQNKIRKQKMEEARKKVKEIKEEKKAKSVIKTSKDGKGLKAKLMRKGLI